MEFSQYSFLLGEHRGKNVVFIKFTYSDELKMQLKKRYPAARWSATNKMWYLPDLPSVREVLNIEPNAFGISEKRNIYPINQRALEVFIGQLKLKAYSPNTIKVYVAEFSHLLILLKDKDVRELTPDRLKSYFLYCVNMLKMIKPISKIQKLCYL